MRAAIVRRLGPPEEVVTIDEVDAAPPGPGEVAVSVRAAGLNLPDVLTVRGLYQVRPDLPFVPGSEFAGVVAEVGDDVTALRPGDRVMGAAATGAFAERVVVPAASLLPVPAGVPDVDAAAFWVAYSTAYHALRTIGRVAAGERVAVLGAAGGVGLAALDVARALGADVVAVASTAEKRATCSARGAAAVVAADPATLKDELRAATGGEGVDVVVDPVGGELSEAALRTLRPGGRFVVVGFASGEIPRIPLNLVLLKDISIRGLNLRTVAALHPEEFARDRADLLARFGDGSLRPLVTDVVALADVAAAMGRIEDRGAVGKIVISVAPDEGGNR